MSTDKDFSECKSYYFYQLAKPEDLTAETYRRRMLKCQQGQHPGFLFLRSGSANLTQAQMDFIKINARNNDALLIAWSDLKTVKVQLSEAVGFETYLLLKDCTELNAALTDLEQPNLFALLQPQTKKHLQSLAAKTESLTKDIRRKISFFPRKYDVAAGQMVSTLDYLDLLKSQKSQILLRNQKIPFWNEGIAEHFELEPMIEKSWGRICSQRRTDLINVSVIIPTYNNSRFLVNVLTHLAEQNRTPETYEVIVVDDGSDDDTNAIVKKFVENHNLDLNLSYFYWSKQDTGRGPQNFFRPGQARNLAAKFAVGEYLVFLDSDMLVPPSFISDCLQELNQNDLIQFQRFHVKQKLSLTNPRWDQISLKNDCYVEEQHYWNQLFQSDDWNQIPQRWKFVCTYALGIRRDEFFEQGRIKRHYISYGFEDTDLGFRMHRKNKKFKLIKTPLLHLTNYSMMQYQNSMFKRHELLSVTAKLFFLDHLDPEIGTTLKVFLDGEKGLIEKFKDRFLSN